ncbi:hypothetical protein [Dokdonia sp. Hel_I_53]|uniref:hypothetical protein n=1 Tax=Dokdonia sp. Hel_I_53 TaxID=1566287 RepID=UPI0011993D67|nr:hypothetical protein [Dokdonia sp. Hel_I_53]TVZ52860.1 hypothetical protein OD90_2046 [Dokdonia sp. Hel_I_53]
MKKYLNLSLLSMILLSIVMFSCSNNTDDIETSDVNADIEMSKILESKYGISTTILDKGGYEFNYPDGRKLFIETNNQGYTISGSRINNESFTLNQVSSEEFNRNMNSQSEMFMNSIPKQEYIKAVNSRTNLDSKLAARLVAPCDEHPSSEDFDKCFKREWDEFCDGMVGCVAQATNPVLIAAVIAGHCAAC